MTMPDEAMPTISDSGKVLEVQCAGCFIVGDFPVFDFGDRTEVEAKCTDCGASTYVPAID